MKDAHRQESAVIALSCTAELHYRTGCSLGVYADADAPRVVANGASCVDYEEQFRRLLSAKQRCIKRGGFVPNWQRALARSAACENVTLV